MVLDKTLQVRESYAGLPSVHHSMGTWGPGCCSGQRTQPTGSPAGPAVLLGQKGNRHCATASWCSKRSSVESCGLLGAEGATNEPVQMALR